MSEVVRVRKRNTVQRSAKLQSATSTNTIIAWVSSIFLLTAILGSPHEAYCQAVLNPNQIKGNIEFVNQNPEIVSALEQQKIRYAYVWAHSSDTSLQLRAYSTVDGNSVDNTGLKVPYELTVESCTDGIPYKLHSNIYLDNYRAYYQVQEKVESAPVFPEPASDVEVNLNQCATMLDIRFVDGDGEPLPVDGGRIEAKRPYEQYPSSTYTQAQKSHLPK